jgi:VWFA-related protein
MMAAKGQAGTMRIYVLVPLGMLLSVLVTVRAQGDPDATQKASPALSSTMKYKVQVDSVFASFREVRGSQGLYVTVQFKVLRSDNGVVATDINKEDIVIEEDGRRVADLEIFQPKAEKLTTVLAMDISGSMESRGQGENAGRRKIDDAKQAARTFLDSLHEKADTGLILFDHEMRSQEKPGTDPARFPEHRQAVRRLIDAAQPGGGTAYLDAASLAIRMIKPFAGRKAVLVMTDGVDMNSKRTLSQVIEEAKTVGVPVYTLGIGDPGKHESVTTVLVLDHSGSMKAKASDKDQLSKIEALHSAASRFVDLMRPNARTTLLPFSTALERPQSFTDDKGGLKARITRLIPEGGTLLYDATLAGIETLIASRAPGKKAVVVLTDGKDEAPGSRHSDQAVIERAKEAGIPLYMLGLGRTDEINETVMKRIAAETGGSYHHAGNQQQLIDLFEKLSIDIHDEGIDEESLKKLAEGTGGKYYPARDVSKLPQLFSDVSEELQSTYTATFRSTRSSHDGTARGIDVKVFQGGRQVSTTGTVDYNVHGVVVPDMDYRIYLVLLVALAGLLGAPAGVRRIYRAHGGA